MASRQHLIHTVHSFMHSYMSLVNDVLYHTKVAADMVLYDPEFVFFPVTKVYICKAKLQKRYITMLQFPYRIVLVRLVKTGVETGEK